MPHLLLPFSQSSYTAHFSGWSPRKRDRFGQVGWHGYDPTTGDSVCFGTEDEIRSWIEQRYDSKGW